VRFLFLFLLLLAAAAALLLLPIRDLIVEFLERVENAGLRGAAVLALAYVPASLLFVPGSLLTLGAGFAFGVVIGTIAVSVGSVLGASAAFLAGRTLARGWIEGLVAKRPKFRAVDKAVERHGFKIVLLTRLSPIFPFNFLNYAYGITKVSFRDYVLASWIGMLPGTLLYVYLGSALKSLADLTAGRLEGGAEQRVFFAIGLVATVAVTIFVTRIARKALREAVPDEEGLGHGTPAPPVEGRA
jgi:uncharacterized membrane protein YdjX (TVP38/TMEM64 family)